MLLELLGVGILGLAAYVKGSEIKEKIDKSEGDSFGEKTLNLVNDTAGDYQQKYEMYREEAERDLDYYGVERVNEKDKEAVSARNMVKAKASADVYNENK